MLKKSVHFVIAINALRPKRLLRIAQTNPLNAELNPICHLLALLGAHHILHVSRVRVNFLLHFLNFRFKTAPIRWQGLRENYTEHCKIACRFEFDLEPGGTLRNFECNSTLGRYLGGFCHSVPCILLRLSTNISMKLNYVDAKYPHYIIVYFEGCGRIKKKIAPKKIRYVTLRL